LYAKSPVPIKKSWRSTIAIGWVIQDEDGGKTEAYFADYAWRWMKWEHGWEHNSKRMDMNLDQVRKTPTRAYLNSDKETDRWKGIKAEIKNNNEISISAVRLLDAKDYKRKFKIGHRRKWSVGYFDLKQRTSRFSRPMEIVFGQ